MQPVELIDETRAIGKPVDWDEEKQGECLTLSVHDHECPVSGGNVMISAWEPNEEELKALNNGALVYLGIRGIVHPVVFMAVN